MTSVDLSADDTLSDMSHSDNDLTPKGEITHPPMFGQPKKLKHIHAQDAYRPESMVIDYDDINL